VIGRGLERSGGRGRGLRGWEGWEGCIDRDRGYDVMFFSRSCFVFSWNEMVEGAAVSGKTECERRRVDFSLIMHFQAGI
jgi:hypothetical protein